MSDRHLLVLGSGSVGRRHLRNLRALGCRVSAMDPLRERLEEASAEGPLEQRFTDDTQALEAGGWDGVVVCSPPKFHVQQCIAALERGLPVLLEKPVSPDAGSAERLAGFTKTCQAPLLLGYTYRWWTPLQHLRERIQSGEVGRPLHVKFVMSAHLADWHPWERYQDFFMASRELGGGALLDESHFIDLALWMFGMPAEVYGRVEKLSSLEIETDDNVDAVFAYPGSLRVTMHLDLYGRPHEKFITVTGEEGTLHWSFDPNRVRYSAKMEQDWQDTEYTLERNDMFVGVAREFLEVLDGRPPSCTAQDGLDVLRVVEAIRESSAGGRAVRPGQSGQ